MSKRLDLRLPEEDIALLEAYCKATGATKTGAVRMLLQLLKNEHLLAIFRKTLADETAPSTNTKGWGLN